MDDRTRTGVTLLELLLVLALAGLFAALSIPPVGRLLADHRLRAAAETLAMDLRRARMAAVRQMEPLYVQFEPGSHWCYRISPQSGCGCPRRDRDDCIDALPAGSGQRFPGVRLSRALFAFGAGETRFDPARGLARPGRLQLQSADDTRLEIRISPLGRIRICRPREQSRPGGYPSCG